MITLGGCWSCPVIKIYFVLLLILLMIRNILFSVGSYHQYRHSHKTSVVPTVVYVPESNL